jgi:hypothetical protein
MAEFEDYATEAAQLEIEIARKGAIIGIDWNNSAQVHKLARQALASHGETIQLDVPMASPEGIAKIELFGLAQLMLKVMQRSAEDNLLTHGGPVWKTFARALWDEAELKK